VLLIWDSVYVSGIIITRPSDVCGRTSSLLLKLYCLTRDLRPVIFQTPKRRPVKCMSDVSS